MIDAENVTGTVTEGPLHYVGTTNLLETEEVDAYYNTRTHELELFFYTRDSVYTGESGGRLDGTSGNLPCSGYFRFFH